MRGFSMPAKSKCKGTDQYLFCRIGEHFLGAGTPARHMKELMRVSHGSDVIVTEDAGEYVLLFLTQASTRHLSSSTASMGSLPCPPPLV